MSDTTTPPVDAPHPLVGVWTGRLHDGTAQQPVTLSFAPDGTVALRSPLGVGTGAWHPAADGRIAYEVTETPTPAAGRSGGVRHRVEARLDGGGLEGRGTATARDATGDAGPAEASSVAFTGDRLTAEPASWHELVTLAAAVRGRTLFPGDDGFAEACSGWLSTVEHRPAAVVVAADADDVAAAVGHAAATRRPVAVQSTGHGASVPADGAILVATSELRELSVDPEARTARIGAGLRWGEVVAAAAEHGLAPLCGSSEQVGVMGYLTGGGLPLACRSHGFAADRVRSLDLVTPDGRRRTASPTQEPDLFWAVRGGRSNFGVVVTADIDLLPLRTVYGGELSYPGEDPEHAAHVLRTYLAWTRRVPDETSSSVTLLRLPDAPRLPDAVRGRSLVQVRVVHTGPAEQAARLLEPLRALHPEKDTCTTLPYPRITEIYHDPKGPVSAHLRSALLRDLDDRAVTQLVSFVDSARTDGLYPNIELRHLGGALDRPPRRPHPVSTRGAAFHLWLRMPAPEQQAEAARRASQEMLARLAPWDTGAQLPGFQFDHDAAAERVRRAYTEADHRRLRELKARYDPHHLFRVNHTIPPAPARRPTRP